MATFFRTDQASISVTIPGIFTGADTSWDKMEGGDNTAETTNYLPGGMLPSIELGGIPKRTDLTVSRIWSDFLIGKYIALDNACGQAPCTVTYMVLAANKTAFPGGTITYTGIVKSVARPNYDSVTSAEAQLVIVVGLNGPING